MSVRGELDQRQVDRRGAEARARAVLYPADAGAYHGKRDPKRALAETWDYAAFPSATRARADAT